MGGCCCCASRRAESDRSPCPRGLEENEPLSASHVMSTAIPAGLLVGPNVDTSSPDTYRAPPPPMPYNVSFTCSQTVPGNTDNCGNKQSADPLSAGGTTSPDEDLKVLDCKTKSDYLVDSPKAKDENLKLETKSAAMDEEDVCPTCLEEYDSENPRITTKCEHHFHLACILEWMERSNTCPVCDQIMEIDETRRE
ncbi:probable E3 ubiquitin-protein ligase RHB1A isoform X2 [Asparagus officinalis]|uniref:probable E3 ubiquitin-protein ligase RHB1A isoform X2 n=1 Tax=Asparagus officinalis TaxID=4686 RepID=UPI00098DFD85|nr:probable E3 ubiquitin-protein ligase RHB1A isoform X2 [Asparagus officinalis]